MSYPTNEPGIPPQPALPPQPTSPQPQQPLPGQEPTSSMPYLTPSVGYAPGQVGYEPTSVQPYVPLPPPAFGPSAAPAPAPAGQRARWLPILAVLAGVLLVATVSMTVAFFVQESHSDKTIADQKSQIQQRDNDLKAKNDELDGAKQQLDAANRDLSSAKDEADSERNRADGAMSCAKAAQDFLAAVSANDNTAGSEAARRMVQYCKGF